MFYLFLLFSLINANDLPFRNYCFNSSYESAHIVKKNFIKCKEEITFITDITTTDTFSRVHFSLISPYNSTCRYGKCHSIFEPGYDFKLFKSCIDDSYEITDKNSTIKSIIIEQEANTTNRYFLQLFHRPNKYCSYRLVRGAIYSNSDAYCTPLMKLKKKNKYIYCTKEDTFPISIIIVIVSLVLVIFSLVFSILFIRWRKTKKLNQMYENTGVQTTIIERTPSTVNYIQLHENLRPTFITDTINTRE